MNWLTKLSSVTITVDGFYKISQPKNISTIGYDMNSWATSHVPRYLTDYKSTGGFAIQSDGLDVEAATGVINWYIPSKTSIDIIKSELPIYISQYIKEELLPLGISASPRQQPEISNMYKIPVWRINITKNSTMSLDTLPSMNIANNNAFEIFKLLNFDFDVDFAGKINAQEMLNKINIAEQHFDSYEVTNEYNDRLLNMMQNSYSDDNSFNFALSKTDKNHIFALLQKLKNLCIFAIQNKFNYIIWS